MKSLAIIPVFVVVIMASIEMFQVSAQGPGCICGYSYLPVCGSNGQTYSNPCLFNCENNNLYRRRLTMRYGQCQTQTPTRAPTQAPACACGYVYAPVCGSNGQTYSNECLFNCDNKRYREQLQIVRYAQCSTQSQPIFGRPIKSEPIAEWTISGPRNQG